MQLDLAHARASCGRSSVAQNVAPLLGQGLVCVVLRLAARSFLGRSHSKFEREVIMKKVFAPSLGKAAAFSAIALAVTAAVAQDAERSLPLVADVNVTENELPKPPEGCHWEKPTYQPPGGNTTVTTGGAAQVTVINHLVCAPRCEGAPLNISLAGASLWLKAGVPPVALSPSFGTPWVPNGSNVMWMNDINTLNRPNGSYDVDIKFCQCPGSTATAKVTNYMADDRGTLTLAPSGLGSPALAGPFSGPGTSPTLSVTNGLLPKTYTLGNKVENLGGGPTGWTMAGTLHIDKGYWGACKTPAGNTDPTR